MVHFQFDMKSMKHVFEIRIWIACLNTNLVDSPLGSVLLTICNLELRTWNEYYLCRVFSCFQFVLLSFIYFILFIFLYMVYYICIFNLLLNLNFLLSFNYLSFSFHVFNFSYFSLFVFESFYFPFSFFLLLIFFLLMCLFFSHKFLLICLSFLLLFSSLISWKIDAEQVNQYTTILFYLQCTNPLFHYVLP